MAGVKNKETTQTATNNMIWFGLQLITKLNGQIYERSFPFWGPTIEFAIDHAKKTNRGPRSERTRWTHVLIHSKLTETATSSTNEQLEIKEIKI